MKKIIILTIMAFVSMACSVANKSVDTIVCGEVINTDSSSSKVLMVYPCDFTMSLDGLVTEVSKTNYKFHKKFPMTHKHNIALEYNGKIYGFMAEPCDSIFVTIDAKSNDIVFSGSKARFNTQLNKSCDYTFSTMNKICKINFNTTADDVVLQIEEKMAIMKDSIENYGVTNSIDDDVKSSLVCNALYNMANFIVTFDRKNSYSPERYRLYTHKIFDIYNSDNAQSVWYGVHISNFMRDFINSDAEVREEMQKDNPDATKVSKLLLNHILKQPKSMMRDIILVKSLSTLQQLSNSTKDFYDDRYVDPKNYFNTNFLNLYVLPIFEPKEQPKIKPIECDLSVESEVRYLNKERVVENLGDIDIIDHLKNSYKGKVIYIDVWATWCGPCVQEMKYAKELHKLYKDSDDVAFVNLCLSSQSKKWVVSIEKNEIGGENYFIATNAASNNIRSKYNLQGYPSYILMDKNGEVVTTSAARPSQLGEVSKQLEKLF